MYGIDPIEDAAPEMDIWRRLPKLPIALTGSDSYAAAVSIFALGNEAFQEVGADSPLRRRHSLNRTGLVLHDTLVKFDDAIRRHMTKALFFFRST